MSDITEEGGTARRLAKARQWIARQGLNGYLPRWEELTPDEQEQAETEARHWINAAVNAGISIVPAGRVVVDLPEPDGREVIHGRAFWAIRVPTDEVQAFLEDGRPYVSFMYTDETPENAERLGLTLVAAAREALRLASGVAGGDVPHE
jgi:predicted transcriptional regulator